MENGMTLLFWLFTKHFVADFPLQASPWMYRNKGTYGHPGGIVHAAIHAWLTLCTVGCWYGHGGGKVAVLAALADGVVHYHIDWAKVNITEHYGLHPLKNESYWILLGFDQYLHALTYFAIAWWLV